MASAREGCCGRVRQGGPGPLVSLSSHSFIVLGCLGLLSTEPLVLAMCGRKGSFGSFRPFSPIGMYPPSACQNERSKQSESGRAGVRVCTGVTGAPSAQGPHLGQGFDAH